MTDGGEHIGPPSTAQTDRLPRTIADASLTFFISLQREEDRR